MRKLSPESSLRSCRIPLMPASATAMAAARTEPPNNASPPTTYPSIIMTTAASRATGTAATSSSASSVTAIMALAGLPGVCCAYQPVITLTSQGPEPVTGPGLPKQHDMSCHLPSTRLSIRIIPRPSGALTAGGHPPRHAACQGVHLGSFLLTDGFAAGVQEAAARGVVHRNRTLIAQHVDHGEELGLGHVHAHPGRRVGVAGNRVPRRHHVHISQSARSAVQPDDGPIPLVPVRAAVDLIVVSRDLPSCNHDHPSRRPRRLVRRVVLAHNDGRPARGHHEHRAILAYGLVVEVDADDGV